MPASVGPSGSQTVSRANLKLGPISTPQQERILGNHSPSSYRSSANLHNQRIIKLVPVDLSECSSSKTCHEHDFLLPYSDKSCMLLVKS